MKNMDFKNGDANYSCQHHFHRNPEEMKELINHIQRKYKKEKYQQLLQKRINNDVTSSFELEEN